MPVKVREAIRIVEADGWYPSAQRAITANTSTLQSPAK